jgi:ATP-binding cassette subfamily C (CFTR/MRP) protein 1
VEIQHSAWEGNCTDALDTDGHYLYESSTATAFLQLMAFVASNCSVDLDNVFGPSVAPCRRSFDFTQLFEESVMGLAPSSLLIVAAFLRLWRLQTCRKEHKRVWNEALRLQKLVALAGLTAMSLVLVVFLAVKPRLRGRVTQIAAIMSFLDTLLLVLLSNWEHLYSIRPSILLEGYLALSVVLDAARARTYWMIDTGHTLAALFSTALAIKIAVLILESRSKRPYLRGGDVLTSTEQTAGMFSLAFWAWLLTFLMKGYRYGLTGLSDLISIDDALLSIPWNGSGTWNTSMSAPLLLVSFHDYIITIYTITS